MTYNKAGGYFNLLLYILQLVCMLYTWKQESQQQQGEELIIQTQYQQADVSIMWYKRLYCDDGHGTRQSALSYIRPTHTKDLMKTITL